jgi:hypothetical protein
VLVERGQRKGGQRVPLPLLLLPSFALTSFRAGLNFHRGDSPHVEPQCEPLGTTRGRTLHQLPTFPRRFRRLLDFERSCLSLAASLRRPLPRLSFLSRLLSIPFLSFVVFSSPSSPTPWNFRPHQPPLPFAAHEASSSPLLPLARCFLLSVLPLRRVSSLSRSFVRSVLFFPPFLSFPVPLSTRRADFLRSHSAR